MFFLRPVYAGNIQMILDPKNGFWISCAAIEPEKNFQVTGILKTYGGPDCYLELEDWKFIN